MSDHARPVTLDRALLGQLSSAEADALEAHLAACQRCNQAHEERRALAERFTREVFPRTASQVRARLTRRRLWMWPLLMTTAAAAAGVLSWPRGQDALSVKSSGWWALQLYARRAGRVFAVGHELLAPGDAVRFVVQPVVARHLLLVAVDGAGQTTVYYPYRGTRSGPAPVGTRFEVPGSIVLDGSPGPERVFAVASEEPLDAEAVLAPLRALAAEGADAIRKTPTVAIPGAVQVSTLFEKETP